MKKLLQFIFLAVIITIVVFAVLVMRGENMKAQEVEYGGPKIADPIPYNQECSELLDSVQDDENAGNLTSFDDFFDTAICTNSFMQDMKTNGKLKVANPNIEKNQLIGFMSNVHKIGSHATNTEDQFVDKESNPGKIKIKKQKTRNNIKDWAGLE